MATARPLGRRPHGKQGGADRTRSSREPEEVRAEVSPRGVGGASNLGLDGPQEPVIAWIDCFVGAHQEGVAEDASVPEQEFSVRAVDVLPTRELGGDRQSAVAIVAMRRSLLMPLISTVKARNQASGQAQTTILEQCSVPLDGGDTVRTPRTDGRLGTPS